MQIIQSIRDKGAAVVIAVIALSLIGFLLMDAQSGNASLFGSQNNNIGSINGQPVSRTEFEERLELMSKQKGGKSSSTDRDQLWEQYVFEKLIREQADKLGLDFTSKELSDLFYSADPTNPIINQKEMLDSITGKPDKAKVDELLRSLRKTKGLTAQEKEMRPMQDEQLNNLALSTISNKYTNMLSASAYYAGWMQERDSKAAKTFANISYVQVGYGLVPDSTIVINDKDVEAFVQKNKTRFKQDAGRQISYVAFNTLPSSTDTASTLQAIQTLKEPFQKDSISNAKFFIGVNGSSMPFFDGYTLKSKMQMVNKDSIVAAGLGKVYGPYMDAGTYVLSKIVGIKTMPDSVKCRHILIGTRDREGNLLMEDSAAKKLCDSIANAIKGGVDFNALNDKYSTDEAAKKDKGVMTFDLNTIQSPGFAKEFSDFIISDNGPSKGVVKTQFGYHYIEVMEKKNPGPAYKIAYLAKQIAASDATINGAQRSASQLAGQVRKAKDLDAYLAKNGLSKVTVPALLKETDSKLERYQPNPYMQQPEPPDARAVVRWAFEAKEGDVCPESHTYGDMIIVPVLDKVHKEGVKNAKDARPMAEAEIRRIKKAEIITKKVGTSFESAIAAYPNTPGVEIKQAGADSSITFASTFIPNIGPEAKLIGTIFGKDAQSKTSVVAGNQGVYVVKVNGYGEKNPENEQQAEAQKKQKMATLRNSSAGNWFEWLKKKAKIKDNRAELY